MTNTELIAEVWRRSELKRHQVEAVFALMTLVVKRQIQLGSIVSVSNLGKFQAKRTPARFGRNPQTQDPIRIPAGKKVKYTPAPSLKNAIN